MVPLDLTVPAFLTDFLITCRRKHFSQAIDPLKSDQVVRGGPAWCSIEGSPNLRQSHGRPRS